TQHALFSLLFRSSSPGAPLHLHSFPTTTLFRSLSSLRQTVCGQTLRRKPCPAPLTLPQAQKATAECADCAPGRRGKPPRLPRNRDRKSTRLNSSHLGTSYAGFCLKKKAPTTDTH